MTQRGVSEHLLLARRESLVRCRERLVAMCDQKALAATFGITSGVLISTNAQSNDAGSKIAGATIAGLSLAGAIGLFLLGGSASPAAGEHAITRSAAELYAADYNRALLRKTFRGMRAAVSGPKGRE